MIKTRCISLLLLSVLIAMLLTPSIPTRSQKPQWEVSAEGVRVTVGNIEIYIGATTGISDIFISGVEVISGLGIWVFAPGWEYIGATPWEGEVLEPPTVDELPDGILVKTHARFSPDTNTYLEFRGVYKIYNTGMIIANTTVTAYDDTEVQAVYFIIYFPIDTLKGQTIYMVYGGTSGITFPEEFSGWSIASGTYSAAYISLPQGDIVFVALEPTALGYELTDGRDWGGNVYEIITTLRSAGMIAKGTTMKVSLMLYPHTRGPEFTKLIVETFGSLGAAKSTVETLKKSKPRTPGGAKLLAECEKEVKLAYDAYSKGDIESTRAHALKALELAQKIKVVERRQRILFFMVIPGIIGIVIMFLLAWSASQKVRKEVAS
ncbi:MAG: hypothetical protein DRJ66_02060 [Thermoprotei archaeon]|nr:MAG: hypothetical protein DRJ66_02060 [Thermoprotei archaeon]